MDTVCLRSGFGANMLGTQHKSPSLSAEAFDITGQRPTLPHTRACSTIGAEGLNFRVRDGNGWVPLAMVTQKPDVGCWLLDVGCSSLNASQPTSNIKNPTSEY